MPRGKSGRGGMGKRTQKKNTGTKRELWFKEEGQEYAQVLSMLGNGKLRAQCFDGKTRLASIRGKMRRRVYIFVNEIILVGLRDFQDERCDVIWKYYPEEAKTLKAMGEIPESTQIDESRKQDDSNTILVKFDAKNDSDESEDEETKLADKIKAPKAPLDMPPSSSEEDSEEDDDDVEMMEEKNPKKALGAQTTSSYKPAQAPEDSSSEDEKFDELGDI